MFYSVLAKHFNNIDLKCIDAVKFFRRIPPKVSADDFLYDNYKLTERDRSKPADGGFRGRFYKYDLTLIPAWISNFIVYEM